MARNDIDNYSDRIDMMLVFALVEAPPADVDAEHVPCLYCQKEMGVCECIPGEKAILDDDDTVIIIDAEFEEVS